MRAAVALALCLILAGCSSGPSAPPSDSKDPTVIADPSDLEASGDGRPHVHDYWRGERTQSLYSGTVELAKDNLPHGILMMRGLAPQECSAVVGSYGGCASVDVEDGDIVYPGTGGINITADVAFSDPAAGTNNGAFVAFTYDSPDRNGTGAIIPFTTGTYSINVTEPMADVGHARVTQWEFKLSLNSGLPYGVTATVDLEMEIVRGPDPIPLAPPHPDFWGSNHRLDLTNYGGDLSDAACRGTMVTPVEAPYPIVLPSPFADSAHPPVVPVDTAALELTLWYNSSTHPALHYDPLLSWHGADKKTAWEQEDVPPTSSQVQSVDGFYQWVIEVEPHMFDSPYANRTAWMIHVPWSGETIGDCGGAHAMKGDFHLVLRAMR